MIEIILPEPRQIQSTTKKTGLKLHALLLRVASIIWYPFTAVVEVMNDTIIFREHLAKIEAAELRNKIFR